MKSLALIASSLLLTASLTAQAPQRIAEGVTVLALPASNGLPARNVAWVELDDYLLVVDGENWQFLSEHFESSTTKPVRFVVNTVGGSASSDSIPPDLTRLAVTDAASATVSDETLGFASDVVLGDDGRVALKSVQGAYAWTVFQVDAGVLFVGDLVGDGRGVDPLPTDQWISVLERLERLNPRVVVPGSGPLGDATVLQATRMALIDIKTAIAVEVAAGKARGEVLAAVSPRSTAILSRDVVEHMYDEFVGVLPATSFVNGLGLREGPSPTAESPGWSPPKKVVVADLWPGRTAQLARVAPGVEVVVASDRQHAAELVEDADAILGWLTPEILGRAQRLRWVALYSAGVERYLAIPGFAASDVVLTNGQRLYALGGAEHVLGMVLSLARRLNTAHSLQLARRWDTAPLTGATPVTGAGSELVELRGKTLLVVGLGGIGTEVARLAHGIGMRVIATRASRREGPPFVEYVGLSSELITLASEADVVVNCVPLTVETSNMFDDEFFVAAKSTAYFINIGRGKTVDTDALTRALREGRIAGAGLDVTEPEPLPSDHELWGMANVIITPHVGGDSDAHMERIWLLFRENLRRFAAGEPLLSVVDKRRGY